MILEQGAKVLIVHRRLFEDDHPRYFIGKVIYYELGMAKVEGHTWVKDPFTGGYAQKPDARTKIISLTSGTLLVYELPEATELHEVRIEAENGGTTITDGQYLKMDLTESVRLVVPRLARRKTSGGAG